jgi:hypothetical protein
VSKTAVSADTMLDWVTLNFIRKGRTQSDAAAALGIRQSLLSMYCSLQRFPGVEEQVRLGALCPGLSMTSWRDAYVRQRAEDREAAE